MAASYNQQPDLVPLSGFGQKLGCVFFFSKCQELRQNRGRVGDGDAKRGFQVVSCESSSFVSAPHPFSF
jgi:hypothetical protein